MSKPKPLQNRQLKHKHSSSTAFLVMKTCFLKYEGYSARAESAAMSQQLPTRP